MRQQNAYDTKSCSFNLEYYIFQFEKSHLIRDRNPTKVFVLHQSITILCTMFFVFFLAVSEIMKHGTSRMLRAVFMWFIYYKIIYLFYRVKAYRMRTAHSILCFDKSIYPIANTVTETAEKQRVISILDGRHQECSNIQRTFPMTLQSTGKKWWFQKRSGFQNQWF